MADQNLPPVPSASPVPAAPAPGVPAGSYPPGPPVPPTYAQGAGYPPGPPASPGYAQGTTYAPYAPQPQRRRSWVWVVVAIMALAVIFGSCALLAAIGSIGSSTSGTTAGLGSAIGVIPIDGEIAGTASGAGVVTPQDFLDELQRAEKDSRVKAIVLRVDSPGGTVAASEEIATYVAQAKKPIVVSIGDVGASGAYMVSSQAKKIIALPGSAVGSIGVISEIPNVNGLLDKLGIQFVVIQAGKYKSAGSPYRALTATETALIQGEVDDAYAQFIDIVARGRHLPRSEVASLATGWAWNGDQAKGLGLVDEIGTYQDALGAAAKLGGIKDGRYQVITYEPPALGGLLSSVLGLERQLSNLSAAQQGVGAAGSPRTSLPK